MIRLITLYSGLRSCGAVFLLALCIALVAAGAQPVFAQTAEGEVSGEDTTTEEDSAPRIRTLPPAYEAQMLRLAEVMGALHYLRALCGADEGQLWRDEMQKLLEAEEPTAERRAQLTAHFNRGFRGYAEIYRECTQPASDAANQFLKQGMRLASEIPNRYGR